MLCAVAFTKVFPKQCESKSLIFTRDLTTLLKLRNFSLTKEIFRQINSMIYLVKLLLSQNFCQKCVRENSCNFHNVCHDFFAKFPSKFNLNCFDGKKMLGSDFFAFPHCARVRSFFRWHFTTTLLAFLTRLIWVKMA